jgi:hypothetical protein
MRQKEKVTTQHMADRKKTQCTRGKVTTEMYDAPKITVHQKMGQRSEKKKPVVGVKRRELSIYET